METASFLYKSATLPMVKRNRPQKIDLQLLNISYPVGISATMKGSNLPSYRVKGVIVYPLKQTHN